MDASAGDRTATTMVHVRVDHNTKEKASKTGPNAATLKAMRAADRGKGKRSRSASALFKELGI